jgi:hypothetical protein
MTIHGAMQTEPGREREALFRKIQRPPCRVARISNTSVFNVEEAELASEEVPGESQGEGAFEGWRKIIFLPPDYRPTRRVWELSIRLLPGLALSDSGRMTTREAEAAFNGFLGEDPHYEKVVERILRDHVGITLRLPGDTTAVIISEPFFEACVEIGDSRLLSELRVLV